MDLFDGPTLRLAALGLAVTIAGGALAIGYTAAAWQFLPGLERGTRIEYCPRPDADGNQNCVRWVEQDARR